MSTGFVMSNRILLFGVSFQARWHLTEDSNFAELAEHALWLTMQPITLPQPSMSTLVHQELHVSNHLR